MRKLIGFIAGLLLPAVALAGVDLSNQFKLGDKAASDKKIVFDKGSGASNPAIRWNNGTSKLQFANDGSTFNDIAASTTTYDQSQDLFNVGLSATVGSNALTIALKGKDGNNPSASNVVTVAFRNATITTGTYTTVAVTAATSLVISSGSTLGQTNGKPDYVYVYAINNAGTLELAASTMPIWDMGALISTTAEGGAGAADSASAVYSTTARTSVPWRMIGRILTTQTTAGTWATSPTEIAVAPFSFQSEKSYCRATRSGSATTIGTSEAHVTMNGTETGYACGGAMASDGTYTAPKTWYYVVRYAVGTYLTASTTFVQMRVRRSDGTFFCTNRVEPLAGASTRYFSLTGGCIIPMASGQTLEIYGSSSATNNIDYGNDYTYFEVSLF